ncbi:antibiotic biosynthesis monooxygenase [Acinetobacter johnsonii]|uniref:putative quinol monooxygenase n=1 Tax=Acinetobacter johnsonii TaxID=40214 RepID=UPI001A27BB1C|nr:antibiotic biosynthesis monooxygenase [Acinetobacter johnsonii]MBJ7436871.1 antibiotic biosynthesis monooxygenase [Acinetobacter sp.]MDH1488863.1 antibiotic biosynthesis monooxygenase [Acinetobacter johnsonii]MDH1614795.1 antibiotic biosynthesis monooxygenase [Acinetobacter johnsonii]
MLTVIAEIICHSEQDFTTVLDSFNNIREQVLKEPGCHLYDVHIDHPAVDSALQTKVPFSIMMYEKWESMQHLETHMHSINMQQHAQATEGAVAHVQIRILEAQ